MKTVNISLVYITSIALLLFVGCSEEKPPMQAPLVYKKTDVLIFLKEQMLEIRADTIHTLAQVPINEGNKLPIGVFTVNKQRVIEIHPDFPQELVSEMDSVYYLEHLLSADDFASISGYLQPTTQVYIFPNYALGKQQFLPCLRCSPQTAALYSSLWLYWRPFNR